MRVTEDVVTIPGPAEGQRIRAVLVSPAGGDTWPGVVLYSDIFQLTASTLRTVRRLASLGFAVCAPEIYPHGELAGVALAFDDDGKRRGQAAADATDVASFDADRAALLTWLEQQPGVAGPYAAAGFCLGGHLALRAALDERVTAAACFYPTGLHHGALGREPADTLARAGELAARVFLVFGSADPHVPATARLQTLAALDAAGVVPELHVVPGEHAFMRDEGPRYDPELTDLCLALGAAFLRRG